MHASRTLHCIVVMALVSALAAVPAPASAAPAEAGAPSAQELYGSAQKLYDAGKYAEALELFRKAYDSSKSPNARLMVATCYAALGRNAEAYEEMAATLAEATERAETDFKYKPTRDAAAKQIEQLEPKVGKVIVDLAGGADAKVTVNGVPVAPARLGSAVAVDPGDVVVLATRPDGGSARRLETIEAGQTKRIAILFDDPRAAQGKVPPAPAAPAGRGGGVRTAGFVVAGLGVAGMAVFAITGAMAQSKFQSLQDECLGARCRDAQYTDTVATGKALTTAANVGLMVGAAGVVSGGLMIVFGGPKSPPPQGSARGLPVDSAMVSYSGTF